MTYISRTRAARSARKLLVVVASGAAALSLLVSLPASAKSPHQVDPAAMVPTLNPDFAPWSCFEAGQGITCQGEYTGSYTNEPTDVVCDGHVAYITGTFREQMTRWHTSDGLALKTIVHLDYPADVWSLSPTGTGPTLTVRGHWERHYTYPVPGNLASRFVSEVGAIYMVTQRGDGLVFHDSGKVTFAPGEDFETITAEHGVHNFYDDPAAIERLICDGLS